MSATVIPFPEPPLAEPCADPARCGQVMELVNIDSRTLVCPVCGLVGHLDATLAELNAALAEAEALEDAGNVIPFKARP